MKKKKRYVTKAKVCSNQVEREMTFYRADGGFKLAYRYFFHNGLTNFIEELTRPFISSTEEEQSFLKMKR